MADPSSCRPESVDPDESPRPPTFVQIRTPARRGAARSMLVIVGIGIALAGALGWAAYRLAVSPADPVAMQAAAPTVTETLPAQPPPADPNAEVAKLATDAAVSAPVWPRQSLMDRISPFDAAVPDHEAPSSAPPADTPDATQDGSYEVSVRLEKGETIGSALQRLGFEAEAIAKAVAALAPHVRLKRLPVGLGMKLQVRPSEKENDKPVLQALTLQPDGRRQITVERDDEGRYVVEAPDRSRVR